MNRVETDERVGKLMTDLRAVIDPELGLNVVELGLIRGAELRDDNAQITMILTTPFCPYGPAIIKEVKVTAEHSLRVPADVEMGMEMWDPSMMEEGAGGDWALF